MEKTKHSLVLFMTDEEWSRLFMQARRIKTDRSSLIMRFIIDIISEVEEETEMSERKALAKKYIEKLVEEYEERL